MMCLAMWHVKCRAGFYWPSMLSTSTNNISKLKRVSSDQSIPDERKRTTLKRLNNSLVDYFDHHVIRFKGLLCPELLRVNLSSQSFQVMDKLCFRRVRRLQSLRPARDLSWREFELGLFSLENFELWEFADIIDKVSQIHYLSLSQRYTRIVWDCYFNQVGCFVLLILIFTLE